MIVPDAEEAAKAHDRIPYAARDLVNDAGLVANATKRRLGTVSWQVREAPLLSARG